VKIKFSIQKKGGENTYSDNIWDLHCLVGFKFPDNSIIISEATDDLRYTNQEGLGPPLLQLEPG
jgi:hypothetical protein